MTKDNVFALIRNLLTIAGGYIIGKSFFGTAVDDNTWQGIIGIVIALVGVVWSILDKTLGIEQLQGAIRHIVSVVGGILIASGKLTAERLDTWLGIITVLVPIIYGLLSKTKSTQLQQGTIAVHQLKKSE